MFSFDMKEKNDKALAKVMNWADIAYIGIIPKAVICTQSFELCSEDVLDVWEISLPFCTWWISP